MKIKISLLRWTLRTFLLCSFFIFVKNDDIFYQNPSLNVKFMNLTLGTVVPADYKSTLFLSDRNQIGVAMAICQADKINQKLVEDINFNGIINIAVQEYDSSDPIGQYSVMQLFKNLLYNSTTKKPLSSQGLSNLGAYFGIERTSVNFVNSKVVSGVLMPFLGAGSTDLSNIVGNTAYSFITVRRTSEYSNPNAVIDLMKAYNWTISGNIFQDDLSGFVDQFVVQTYASNNPTPIFTCNRILKSSDLEGTAFFTEFCKCMTNIDKLTVVNVWTTSSIAFDVISKIKANCKASKNFIFIVTGESVVLPPEIFNDPTTFQYSFFIRAYGPWNAKQYLDECLSTASPTAKSAIESLIKKNLETRFNCVQESRNDLEKCPVNILDRPSICQCTGDEYEYRQNPSLSQTFFYADSVSVIANAVGLIQNNCSFVNEILKDPNVNYCTISEITPEILSGLIRNAKYVGYTGNISYKTNFRQEKAYYVYNVQTSIADAVLVGNFTINGYYLDKSAVLLPNGNNSISELVPQNPSIEYGVIAVFFGIEIFLLIMTLVAGVLLIYFIDHPVIRRNTPWLSMIILVGNILGTIGLMILSLGISDASCNIFIYSVNIAGAMILSAVIAKSYRIYRIFHNKRATAVKVSETSLALFICIFVLYFLLIAIAFTITGLGAEIIRSQYDQFYYYYSCECSSKFWGIFLVIFNEVSSFLLRLVVIVFAWKNRNIVAAYSEADDIMILAVTHACFDIFFLPLLYTTGDSKNSAVYKLVILSIYVLFIRFMALIFLFYTRFYDIYLYEKYKKNPEERILDD